MSQTDKLIADILKLNPNLRFEDLAKALIRMGYEQSQPKGGSSHYTFRKHGERPVTLPKTRSHIDIVYIRLVKIATEKFLEKGE